MRVYTVHTHPAKPPEDFVFVKEGFCWPGLIIPFFWMLFRGMWIPLLAYLAALVLINGLGGGSVISPGMVPVLTIALQLFIGLEGNNLRRWTLKRRGFHFSDIVVAGNVGEAEAKYFTERATPDDTPPHPPVSEARQPGLPV